MSYKLQLLDAQNSADLKAVANVCSTTQAFTDLINTAQRRLAKRGQFYGMVQNMRLCFRGCRPVLPRYVETLIAARTCGGEIQIQNQWGNFPPQDRSLWYSWLGAWAQPFNDFSANLYLNDTGEVPTYNEITGNQGKQIRYYVVHASDIGKKITLYGKSFGGQPLQEKDASGNWVNGLTLTAASPFVSSNILITQIDSITRDTTDGMAYLYQYDSASNNLIDLAAFEPSETNPRYRRMNFKAWNQNNQLDASGNPCVNQIEALVKLAFIPVSAPRDFLLVDDLDALTFMVQALKAEQADDNAGAETLIMKSIRELNFTDRDKNPDNQTPVRMRVTMSRRVIRNPI